MEYNWLGKKKCTISSASQSQQYGEEGSLTESQQCRDKPGVGPSGVVCSLAEQGVEGIIVSKLIKAPSTYQPITLQNIYEGINL